MARRWVIFFGIAAVGLALSYQTAVAAKSATPQELKQKVEEAVKFVSEKGEAAYPEISNPAGPWAWKDTYIFVVDFNGTNLAHSNPPSLTGKNIMNLKDVKGNMFGAEFVATAKSEKGKGWVEYWWPKMGGQEPALKTVYVMRVPGKDCLVGAGVYDISKEEAIKAVGE